MPARHRPGALSSSDGRQPLWMLLPPHGTRQPYSAGQTALPSGTRRCPAASKAAGTATSLSRERPLHPWQVAATYTAVGRRSCRGAPQHEAGGRGRRRYIAAPHAVHAELGALIARGRPCARGCPLVLQQDAIRETCRVALQQQAVAGCRHAWWTHLRIWAPRRPEAPLPTRLNSQGRCHPVLYTPAGLISPRHGPQQPACRRA